KPVAKPTERARSASKVRPCLRCGLNFATGPKKALLIEHLAHVARERVGLEGFLQERVAAVPERGLIAFRADVAGHVKDSHPLMPSGHAVGQLAAAHPRHDHI